MSKPIAVIILNWNGAKLLKEFLPSVCKNTNSEIADVIVADNGSTDNSREVLQNEFPNVKTILFDDNHGFAEGYNLAIKKCQEYKYTVLLNSDVQVEANWLEPLFDYCEKHPEVAACQPKILSYKEPQLFEYAGAAGGFIDKLGYPYCRGRIFSSVEKDNGQYDTEPIDIMWATGAALFVRTDVYLAVGGLDKKFFAHMEEIDLCWRIHLAGHKIKAITSGAVFHLGGGSLPASNPRKTYLNFRNNLLLLHKNLPKKDGKKLLFIRRLYDTLAFFMFVAKCDFPNAKAIIKAHMDFKKMRKEYTSFPSKNLIGSLPGSNCNIIIDYYLKGRKTF